MRRKLERNEQDLEMNAKEIIMVQLGLKGARVVLAPRNNFECAGCNLLLKTTSHSGPFPFHVPSISLHFCPTIVVSCYSFPLLLQPFYLDLDMPKVSRGRKRTYFATVPSIKKPIQFQHKETYTI